MRHPLKLSLPAIATALLLAACGSGGGYAGGKTGGSAGGAKSTAQTGGSSGTVVKTGSSAALGTILVDSQGMTLYHLSGEGAGKFICTTSACLGAWHPLTVSAGSTPKGTVSSLGTVKRPEGTTQVTYKGSPLYTFAQDSEPGETNGEGIKDVGTWTAVTTSGGSSASTGGSSAASSGEESAYSYGEEGGYKY
ncbi:MAG TPA: hypothetical protein VGF95_07895 [Solirubrobacteraceae bacterium]|jgi:predicted lipoprotein with Yx(FWY)xxD motif